MLKRKFINNNGQMDYNPFKGEGVKHRCLRNKAADYFWSRSLNSDLGIPQRLLVYLLEY